MHRRRGQQEEHEGLLKVEKKIQKKMADRVEGVTSLDRH
jgi:hypothetical protein